MFRFRNCSKNRRLAPKPLTGSGGPLGLGLGCLSVVLLAGCGQQPVSFSTNPAFAAKIEQELGQPMDRAQQDVEAILVDLFGTPDAPRLPPAITDDESLAGLLDRERLSRAAGAVASDREGAHKGLYREHCSTCHGVSGDGLGPAALFQNPYPRDYRMGVYKYKSTPRGAQPTREDLTDTILQGLPGTSMPAFRLLPEEDVAAVVDYVIYLSIRGELQRRLLVAAAMEFDYSDDPEYADPLLRPAMQDGHPEEYAAQSDWIEAELHDIARGWAAADSQVPAIPSPSAPSVAAAPPQSSGQADPRALTFVRVGELGWQESIAIGRDLFHGQIANCSSCHGDNGAGGLLPPDYDDWTKEWTTQLGIDPEDHESLEPFLAAGALPPRALPARRLTLGGFRGGDSPRAIYLRIVHGIDGTPMPAINLVESESETGLTTDQVWHLVNYVLSLGDLSFGPGAIQ